MIEGQIPRHIAIAIVGGGIIVIFIFIFTFAAIVAAGVATPRQIFEKLGLGTWFHAPMASFARTAATGRGAAFELDESLI